MGRNRGLTEPKAQRWRALVTYTNGKEGLLFLGSSFTQVNEGYDEPFFDLLDDEEREQVKSISLQKWQGAPDAGRWVTQRSLPIPEENPLRITTRRQGEPAHAPND